MNCICHNISFKEIQEKGNAFSSFQEVLDNVDFGKKCKLCHSYLKELFRFQDDLYGYYDLSGTRYYFFSEKEAELFMKNKNIHSLMDEIRKNR